jgi:hypothetical protein
MKRDSIVLPVLVLILLLVFSGMAMAGEPAGCPDLDPTKGPFLFGTFTAARDKSFCTNQYSEACPHYYEFHVVLTHRLKVHLFSFVADLEDLRLCDYVASNPNDPDNPGLKEIGAKLPCILGVGEAFGLTGVPVIYNLKITGRDFCGTADEMILGLITIRVVPVP